MVSADSTTKRTLIKQINITIKNGDYKAADSLVNELCESQGMKLEYAMPASFVSDLKEREKKAMKIKKHLAKAAAIMLIVSISGGTAYAAVSYFKSTQHFDHGLATSDIASEENTTSQFSDVRLPDKDTEVEVLSTETGNEKTAWLSKETRQETNYGYTSDDGINWKADTPDIQIITKYQYSDYAAAKEEHGLPELFSKTYNLIGNVTLEEYRHKSEEQVFSKNLQADYKYENGSFTINMEKDCQWNGEDSEIAVITSTEPVKNQREYTASNGYCFKLSDDTEFGTVRTTTLISYKEYHIILSFFDLSDEEIHEILDSIVIE